jgi:hypothetical protein
VAGLGVAQDPVIVSRRAERVLDNVGVIVDSTASAPTSMKACIHVATVPIVWRPGPRRRQGTAVREWINSPVLLHRRACNLSLLDLFID